jgi:hypothetical protein
MDIDCRMEDGLLCLECCKWMTFIVDFSEMNEVQRQKQVGFYITRGCKITKLPKGKIAITVPSVCPQLTILGCSIQASQRKPAVCKEYDCRLDPFLKDGKYFNQLNGTTTRFEKKEDAIPERKKRFPVTIQEE